MKGLPSSISENLRFLVAEVSNQLDELKYFFSSHSAKRAQRILDRKGYGENLMLRIQDACIQGIAESGQRRVQRLRAIQSVAADLERISGLGRDAVNQLRHIEEREVISGKRHLAMLDNVIHGIDLIEDILRESDTRLALKLGELERKTDLEYRKLLSDYTRALKNRKRTEDFIAALLIAHTLERMGDLLLDIGEALLSSIVGQPVDMDRYHSLMDSLQSLSEAGDDHKMGVEPIAETRSGSGISGITRERKGRKKSSGYVGIYKDGLPRKLKEEREGVENWHELYPGLAPRILSYKKRGGSASMVIEHLAGMTFEQILVNEPDELLEQTLRKLGRTLNNVWKETRIKKQVSAGYMRQLDKRLGDVYAVHPEFDSGECKICGYEMTAFGQLVKAVEKIEQGIKPPFSVYIHGDFNVDNIIYDPREGKISYIDLHRSRYMDYVQDVSVFMVSNYRLQIMAAPVRRRIVKIIRDFYKTTGRYARRNDDALFDIRLALGLARSFVTSTRFILDKSLARDMFLRGRYLLEQVARLKPDAYANYKVPVKELFVV